MLAVLAQILNQTAIILVAIEVGVVRACTRCVLAFFMCVVLLGEAKLV